MKLRKVFWLALIAIMTMALAACGGDDDGGDDNGGGDSSELSQTASFEDTEAGFTLTINYPEGWATNTDDGITLANSEEAIALVNGNTAPTDGQAGGLFIPLPADQLGVEGTAELAFQAAQGFLLAEAEVGEPEAITVDGNDGLRSTGTLDFQDSGTIVDYALYVVPINDIFVLGYFLAEEGGISDHLSTLDAVFSSVNLSTE